MKPDFPIHNDTAPSLEAAAAAIRPPDPNGLSLDQVLAVIKDDALQIASTLRLKSRRPSGGPSGPETLAVAIREALLRYFRHCEVTGIIQGQVQPTVISHQWLATAQFNTEESSAEADGLRVTGLRVRADPHVPPATAPSAGLTHVPKQGPPKKPGPPPITTRRVLAAMREYAIADLDVMKAVVRQRTFGAAPSTCRVALSLLKEERRSSAMI